MESVLQIIALIAIVLFLISLADDPITSITTDFVPKRFAKKLRWTLGIIALISVLSMFIPL